MTDNSTSLIVFLRPSKNINAKSYFTDLSIKEVDMVTASTVKIPLQHILDNFPARNVKTKSGSNVQDELDLLISGEVGVSNNFLSLPDKYNLVVGDTFELFYKGIIKLLKSNNYSVKIDGSKGQAFTNRYIFTPKISDIGTHNLKFTLLDDFSNKLGEKTVQLEVKSKATNPSYVKNVLTLGDSLTTTGFWHDELYRRIKTVDGLSNINFVGDGSVEKGYIAYGGWTLTDFLTNKTTSDKLWITTTHDKTVVDQHSLYKDTLNGVWSLETIEVGRIGLVRKEGATTLPTSSNLTWVSGGVNNTNIVYTSTEQGNNNPLWNTAKGRIDFRNYITAKGVSGLSVVNVLLGWNDYQKSIPELKLEFEQLISILKGDYPTCKLNLIGLQVPSYDGIANNYGILNSYFRLSKYVFDFNELLLELEKENENVTFIHLSSQFDTDNNMIEEERTVNIRNTKKENYVVNGIHPAKMGLMQIADAVYRNIHYQL